MADNFTVKDAGGTTITIRAKDDGTGKYVGQSIASDATGAVLIGQKAMAGSLPVVIASDQSAITVTTHAVTQSGTWVSTGAAASGAAKSGNPVLIGGQDGTNAVTVLTDSSGRPRVDLATIAGTAADVNSGNKSAGTLRVVLATDQPQLTNKLLVTPDANSAVNVAQINGVAATMGNGVSGTGVLRVTVASDSTGQIALAAGSNTIGALTANQSVNTTLLGGNAINTGSGTTSTGTARVTIATDDIVSAVLAAGTQTLTTSFTRPADTTAYAINDSISDSTSAPTSGGFTFTSAARASGKGGIITDLFVTSSNAPGTTLQGELWILNQAGTNTNDNAAWVMSAANIKNVVAVIPFSLIADASGSWAHVQGLNIGYTCAGSADLRFLVKAKNAYTPANAEVFQFMLKVYQNN